MGKFSSKPRTRRAGAVAAAVEFQRLENRLLFATFDVTDYGAQTADNGFNDLPALQAAMNASGPGDTIYFPAGTYNFSGFTSPTDNGLILASDRIYRGEKAALGDSLATVKGKDGKGPQFNVRGDNVTFDHLIFREGGIYFERVGTYNTNIQVDNCEFYITGGGENNNGITCNSGLRNSTISNSSFTGTAAFGIYGHGGRDRLIVKNNEFTDMSQAVHIESFNSNDADSVFEQNYFSGLKGMGIEIQRFGIRTIVQDNWFENPNLSTTPGKNDHSMAYSIILDKSFDTIVRRNYIYAPQRPDGIGCRIGIEIGGHNALVEDNYINWINAPIADNDGDRVGPSVVYVRNNYIANNREGVQINHPSSNPLTIMHASNNGSHVQTTWNPSVRGRPYRNVRYGEGPPPNPEDPPPPPPPTLGAVATGLTAITVGVNQVDLSWTDNATNETDYVIQILADDGVTWNSIAIVGANVTNWSLMNAGSGRTLSFRLLTHNAAGYSEPSASTSVRTPLTDVVAVALAANPTRRIKPSFIGSSSAVAPPTSATS